MSPSAKIPILIIFGATASGKTEIAERFFADAPDSLKPLTSSLDLRDLVEIVSADSVQVYKDMAIGSAQPSKDFLARLTHHLIAIQTADKEFSVADFVRMGDACCKDIFARKKIPVLLGGTAFYFKNFMYGLPITPQADMSVRAYFQKRLEQEGSEVLLEELKKIDPISSAKIHSNDAYRIIRAHEVYACSGKPLSSFGVSEHYREGYDFFIVSLDRPREDLYERIERRVDAMIEEGLQKEFASLYKKGYDAKSPGMKGIGYREFFDISFENPLLAPIDEVAAMIKKNSKRYAKRQETFFKAIPHVNHFMISEQSEVERLHEAVSQFIFNSLPKG